MAHTIYHDLKIKASIDEVYDAITKPKHLVNWWPLKCDGRPKEGEIYNFYFSPEYDWFGRVVSLVENKHFEIKMTKSDPDWDPTSFRFELKQDGYNEVLVSFSHHGWPHCNAHYKRSSYCWALLLNGLKTYLEKGIIVPYEERE